MSAVLEQTKEEIKKHKEEWEEREAARIKQQQENEKNEAET